MLVAVATLPGVFGFVHLIPQTMGVSHGVSDYELGVQAWNMRQAEQGLEWFLRSAQKGHQVGEYCFRYGMYHELPPLDLQQAFRWYKRGARMNHRGSTTMLGKLHFAAGQREEAIEVLQRTGSPGGHGGERGDSLAQWFLGELFLQLGRLRLAVKWWKKSAENGDSDAMWRLFEVLQEGAVGIPCEPMLARHWLFAAAAHGHKEALNHVNWATALRPKVEQNWVDFMERKGWI